MASLCLQLDMLSELKSTTDNERAELSNQLITCQQSLSEKNKELQRLQENFDQVTSATSLLTFCTNHRQNHRPECD